MGVTAAARAAGVSWPTGQEWFVKAGGVCGNGTRPVSGRYLSFAEREEIALGRAAGLSMREIGRRLGRPVSTVSREIARNSRTARPRRYLAGAAQAKADQRARRPKPALLAVNSRLREEVQRRLTRRHSPRQISARLRIDFPDDPEMWVSHETIYQSLYVQGRGALRRELATCLRTGRTLRRPHRAERKTGRGQIPGMIMLSERPAEADDRAVPGHWEGDLIIGKNNKSAIGTLVERATRYCLLLHLPRYDAVSVRDAMITTIGALPKHLWRSLAWDQGSEMNRHAEITLATDLDIYFCDPHSPWQRGSNENTNGLLRQYFPKGTDLTAHTPEHLAAIAAELNGRPRQTLGWHTPAEALHQLLFPPTSTVATTG
ncbi:IS30 family transposase [Lentzea sp. CA-135723]|uniref:IS30 family transposase n=1 Tax=Lentzea sp. CA-135723 TaxID=3239950 RepID=UPI003D938BBE